MSATTLSIVPLVSIDSLPSSPHPKNNSALHRVMSWCFPCRKSVFQLMVTVIFVDAFALLLRLSHRSAPDEPQSSHHPAFQAVCIDQYHSHRLTNTRSTEPQLTVSGVSPGWTFWPSNKNRADLGSFPCLSQNAFMSLSSLVLRLILKKTSLLPSVTLMFKCSVAPAGVVGPSPAPFGEC